MDFYSPFPQSHYQPQGSAGDARYAPGPSVRSTARASDPKTHTLNPYVTGTSILAMKYKGGVMLVADTIASYGSLARFSNYSRLASIGDTLLGASGDLSDFQFLLKDLEAMHLEEKSAEDGTTRGPKALYTYLVRVYYSRRSKFDPLWNQLVIAGCRDGKPFLGTVDLHGTSYEDVELATGYGAYIARPLLRNAYKEDMTEAECRETLANAMKVMFYRDCRASNKVQFATVTAEKVTIEEPIELDTQWEFKQFIKSGAL